MVVVASVFGFSGGGAGAAGSGAGGTSQLDRFTYNMNHQKRGLFVIINNRNFHKSTGMNDRSGTDVDAANLFQKFKGLGFDARIFNNQTCEEMVNIMKRGTEHLT